MERPTAAGVLAGPRQAEADLAHGLPIAQACQRLGASAQAPHRRPNRYGGLDQDEARRLGGPGARGARPSAWPPSRPRAGRRPGGSPRTSGDRRPAAAGGAAPPRGPPGCRSAGPAACRGSRAPPGGRGPGATRGAGGRWRAGRGRSGGPRAPATAGSGRCGGGGAGGAAGAGVRPRPASQPVGVSDAGGGRGVVPWGRRRRATPARGHDGNG